MKIQIKIAASLLSAASVSALAMGSLTANAQTVPTKLNGQGATFPDVLYTGGASPTALTKSDSWFSVYGKDLKATNTDAGNNGSSSFGLGPVNTNLTISYGGIGSGGGVTALKTCTPSAAVAGEVVPSPFHFAGSDNPLALSDTGAVPCAGADIVQVPVAAGAIAIAYNLPSFTGKIRVSQKELCEILNGDITNFNQITSTPGLPNQSLTVVRRSDSSGTTSSLTRALDRQTDVAPFPIAGMCDGLGGKLLWTRGAGSVSEAVGVNDTDPATVDWPDSFVPQAGAAALADAVKNNVGFVGYMDYAVAKKLKLKSFLVANDSGSFKDPKDSVAVSAALNGLTDLDPNPLRMQLRNDVPIGSAPYPIVAITNLMFYTTYSAPQFGGNGAQFASSIQNLVTWITTTTSKAQCKVAPTNTGADCIATKTGYAPLPNAIKTQVNTLVQANVNP